MQNLDLDVVLGHVLVRRWFDGVVVTLGGAAVYCRKSGHGHKDALFEV
jgi:hypothetical protein